jgi:hypothetical protein
VHAVAKELLHEHVQLLYRFGQGKARAGKRKIKLLLRCPSSCRVMRTKVNAHVKSGQKTGGRQSATKKRKSASALANAAGLRAVKALEARRKGTADAEDDVDELEVGGAEPEEGEEEEEEGEESGEIDEQESQEAETQMEPHIQKRKRSKVLIVSLPLHPSICPDVIRESARSAGQILKWVVSGIF